MFNLADYETVETRLEKFIKDFPDFRISTELESFQNDRFHDLRMSDRHNSFENFLRRLRWCPME